MEAGRRALPLHGLAQGERLAGLARGGAGLACRPGLAGPGCLGNSAGRWFTWWARLAPWAAGRPVSTWLPFLWVFQRLGA